MVLCHVVRITWDALRDLHDLFGVSVGLCGLLVVLKGSPYIIQPVWRPAADLDAGAPVVAALPEPKRKGKSSPHVLRGAS